MIIKQIDAQLQEQPPAVGISCPVPPTPNRTVVVDVLLLCVSIKSGH